jgi:anti-sigma factor RsiW
MAFVLVQPCIGVKDASCVEVFPWTVYTPMTRRVSTSSIPTSASTVVPVWILARWTRNCSSSAVVSAPSGAANTKQRWLCDTGD